MSFIDEFKFAATVPRAFISIAVISYLQSIHMAKFSLTVATISILAWSISPMVSHLIDLFPSNMQKTKEFTRGKK